MEHDGISSRKYKEDWEDCLVSLKNAEEISRKYEDRYFAALKLLKNIVDEYNAHADGTLGNGFTNGPFLAARVFLGEG